jgi:hypothetical protein
MKTVTQGQVTIRPVSFIGGRIRRRLYETSNLWFTPTAEPPAGRVFLVVVPNGHDDDECPDPKLCEAMAERQFGPPAERSQFGNATIRVWHKPLVDAIAG